MSDRDVEAALRKIASKAGQMAVAAPLNDAQLLALVAGIIHASRSPNEGRIPERMYTEQSVATAVGLVAASVGAVRNGDLQRAIAAATGEANPQPNGEPVAT